MTKTYGSLPLIHRSFFLLLTTLVIFCVLHPATANAAIAPAVSQKLASGAILVTRDDKVAPRVAISLLIRAGAGDETAATAGWRQVLMGAVLRATKIEGEKVRTTPEWQRLGETWGGQFGATTGEDFIEIWARGDSAFAPQLLESLLQIAAAPRLSDDDIAWARRRALEVVGQPEGGVARRAAQSIADALYRDEKGAPLAYALPDYGTFESLSNLSNEQLREYYTRYFTAPRLVVSAAGDVDATALRSVLEKAKGNLATVEPGTRLPSPVPPVFAPLSVTAPVTVHEPASNAWVFTAYRTPPPAALPPPDYVAIRVFAAALGDSPLSRLKERLVREKTAVERKDKIKAKEVAPQVAAQWTPRRWAGELVLMAQCDPANADAVKKALVDEIQKIATTPLSANELTAAKNFVRGEWATEREMPRERAFQTSLPLVWGTFSDTEWPVKIAAVTPADIQRVAKQYLQTYSVIFILPEE